MNKRANPIHLLWALSGLLFCVLASGSDLMLFEQVAVLLLPVSVNSEPGLNASASEEGCRKGDPTCVSPGTGKVSIVPHLSQPSQTGGDDKQAGWGSAGEVGDHEEQTFAGGLPGGKMESHDPGLMISVESVLKRLKAQEEMTLIDIRDPKAFERVRIPGSLNIPLYAVRSKQFLISKVLVLLNEGFNHGQLEQGCRRLREYGFLAWILEGGLKGWSEAGGPLDGDTMVRNDLNKVTPQDLFEERNFDNWIAVDAGKSKNPKNPPPFFKVISLDSIDSEEKISLSLSGFPGRQKLKHALRFVIFNEDGKGYESLRKAFEKAKSSDVFYLEGGLEGYRAFLWQQATPLQRDDYPTKTIEKCKNCP